MRLENDISKYNDDVFIFWFTTIATTLVCLISLIIPIIFGIWEWIAILGIVVVIFLGSIIIFASHSVVDEKNISRKKIKELGKNEIANIVDVGNYYTRYGRRYYIVLWYQDKIVKIHGIKENKAYDILKLLLDSYPVKETKMIPIEIYVHKNKVYADLDSVDLTKVDGYEEAKRIVEELYNK